MRVCAQSYSTLLGHVPWMSLGDLYFLFLFGFVVVCFFLFYCLVLKGNRGVDVGKGEGAGRDWKKWREGKPVGMQCMRKE